MKEFKLSILEGDSTFYDGPCESLIFPATDGQVGILADHTNTISAVEAGTIMYRTPDGEEFYAAVSQGIIKIEDNEVLMLVNSAERPDEIDENRARYEAEKAKEAMLQKRTRMEYYSAEATLSRAMSRLKVKSRYGK
jgi:F-type H+-transporting ATPase subunit epsilon